VRLAEHSQQFGRISGLAQPLKHGLTGFFKQALFFKGKSSAHAFAHYGGRRFYYKARKPNFQNPFEL
jgi:hypothetical protein